MKFPEPCRGVRRRAVGPCVRSFKGIHRRGAERAELHTAFEQQHATVRSIDEAAVRAAPHPYRRPFLEKILRNAPPASRARMKSANARQRAAPLTSFERLARHPARYQPHHLGAAVAA